MASTALQREAEPETIDLFAPIFPNLAPGMLLPRSARAVFPLHAPNIQYYYLARNALFALAMLWELRGKEVLFPAYFHGVELEVLLSAGAVPRFYAVRAGMRVEAGEVASRITAKTKAVYLIHYLGFPSPVQELAKVCRGLGIPLIEDCALAFLSKSGEVPLGSFGDASIFCFYKTLPVPNGGALVLRHGGGAGLPTVAPPPRAALSMLASSMLTHFELHGRGGMQWVVQGIRDVGRRMLRRTRSEEWIGVGTNHFEPNHARFGMSRFNHLVLAGQNYAKIVEHRRRNYARLLERLRELTPPIFDELPEGVCPLFYPIAVRDKSGFRKALAARGIESVDFWSGTNPVVPSGAFPEVERMRRSIVELPCQQDLTREDMDRVADAVVSAREHVSSA